MIGTRAKFEAPNCAYYHHTHTPARRARACAPWRWLGLRAHQCSTNIEYSTSANRKPPNTTPKKEGGLPHKNQKNIGNRTGFAILPLRSRKSLAVTLILGMDLFGLAVLQSQGGYLPLTKGVFGCDRALSLSPEKCKGHLRHEKY